MPPHDVIMQDTRCAMSRIVQPDNIRAPFNKSNLIKLKYFLLCMSVLISKTTHEHECGAHARCTATHYTDYSEREEGIYYSPAMIHDIESSR